MSDMNESDLAPQADVTPAAEPVAPEQSEPDIEMLDPDVSQFKTLLSALPAAPEPTPVVATQPSSASETQKPEAAVEVEAPPLSLEDAVVAFVALVKEHRTVGDGDLAEALAAVEAALASK